jgi:hypothetical protein
MELWTMEIGLASSRTLKPLKFTTEVTEEFHQGHGGFSTPKTQNPDSSDFTTEVTEEFHQGHGGFSTPKTQNPKLRELCATFAFLALK